MRTFRFIELGEQASISAVFRCCCALMAASFFALPWSWPSHSQSQCPELCIRFMSVVAARAHELYFFRLCGCATATCPPPPFLFSLTGSFCLALFFHQPAAPRKIAYGSAMSPANLMPICTLQKGPAARPGLAWEHPHLRLRSTLCFHPFSMLFFFLASFLSTPVLID